MIKWLTVINVGYPPQLPLLPVPMYRVVNVVHTGGIRLYRAHRPNVVLVNNRHILQVGTDHAKGINRPGKVVAGGVGRLYYFNARKVLLTRQVRSKEAKGRRKKEKPD